MSIFRITGRNAGYGLISRLLPDLYACCFQGRSMSAPIAEIAESSPRRGDTTSENSGRLAADIRLLGGAALLGIALFSSGAAGLINQVVWQRSLKVFLGGSETICSSVVVLVFMAGLGAGSWWCGRRVGQLRRPLRLFALLEIALGCVNLGVWALLTADVSESVFAMQRLAAGVGIPLLLMYAASAVVVLAIPCLLMGATMPLAAQVCQSHLGLRQSRLLAWLFAINTAGSVAGAVVSSGTMIPQLGLSISMMTGALLNLSAGVVLAGMWMLTGRNAARIAANRPTERPRTASRSWIPDTTELLALGLGFCSLGYEMHLFRLMPLKHLPLPFTFAAVLTGFLAFWSLGAALSSAKRGLSMVRGIKLCTVGCVLSIALVGVDSMTAVHDTGSLLLFVIRKTPFFLPCILFGYLFTQVTERAASSWGRDVGRICVWNTVGSCLGILGMTFVGYQIPFFLAIIVLALVLLSLTRCAAGLADRAPSGGESGACRSVTWPAPLPLIGAVLLTTGCLLTDTSRIVPGYRLFCGRDGVIVVHDNGDLIWDGLWHSRLSDGTDHVGTHNWHMGVVSAACSPEKPDQEVCVIGVGTGITASTLALMDNVRRVDAYDISRVLEDVFAEFPEGTLGLTENPKINLIWQDARSGLELNPKQYDIIQTQPLYLKQAGSALLNSVEFFELISRRLKPDGVFCLYSNGTPAQAFSIRQTADQVFPYRQSFFRGYLLILSKEPVALDEQALERCLRSDDLLWQEVAGYGPTSTAEHLLALQDTPRLPAHGSVLVVRDDQPIVEYPRMLEQQVRDARLPFELPQPDSAHSRHDRRR